MPIMVGPGEPGECNLGDDGMVGFLVSNLASSLCEVLLKAITVCVKERRRAKVRFLYVGWDPWRSAAKSRGAVGSLNLPDGSNRVLNDRFAVQAARHPCLVRRSSEAATGRSSYGA